MSFSYSKFKKKVLAPIFQALGKSQTVNSQTITVLGLNNAGDITSANGTVAVTDGGAGYAKGCLYTKTNATISQSAVFQNIGSSNTCQFVVISVSSGGGVVQSYSETITMVANRGTLTFVPLIVQSVFVNPPSASVTGSFVVIPQDQNLLLARQCNVSFTSGFIVFRAGDSVSQAFVTYLRS